MAIKSMNKIAILEAPFLCLKECMQDLTLAPIKTTY